MPYYEFTPGQKARYWISGERCEPTELGPLMSGHLESVRPGDVIPDHLAVAEPLAKIHTKEGYTLTKIGG